MINALLLSNSTMPGTPFFTWPRPWIKQFLGESDKRLVFIPYAAVTISHAEYTNKVKEAFAELGYSLFGINDAGDKEQMFAEAEGIVVGGGNTFALLNGLYEHGYLELISERVKSGVPYIGWSAGANLACPTIMTTNDMPVVRPPSFDALGLVPFQINPHYHELKFEGQGGETRKERLEEFLVVNPEKKVIGLPEGMLLQRSGDKLFLKGISSRESAVPGLGVAKLYEAGKDVADLRPGEVSFLLEGRDD
jgi:dipeptidase E